jgi:hypothetical protein
VNVPPTPIPTTAMRATLAVVVGWARQSVAMREIVVIYGSLRNRHEARFPSRKGRVCYPSGKAPRFGEFGYGVAPGLLLPRRFSCARRGRWCRRRCPQGPRDRDRRCDTSARWQICPPFVTTEGEIALTVHTILHALDT